jgi:hypothetical protein
MVGLTCSTRDIRTVADFWARWYFDVVSTHSKNESINVVFYNAGSVGFPGGYDDGPLSVGLSGTFENGTLFAYNLPVTHKVVIIENEEGLTGDWQGTGAWFAGSSLSRPRIVYEVVVDSPDIGVCGKIKLRSVAPPRYSCSRDAPGANELAFLNVGWSNAVPDADATVDFDVDGSRLQFKGLGYHDKNWGLTPFANDVKHTYWGHARVGPYSVVFSDGQIPIAGGPNTTEMVSATVSKHGKFVELSCAEKAVVVRPWGGNDAYPPTAGSAPPLGLELTFRLGRNDILRLNVTNNLIIDDEPVYQRFIGSVEGRVNGGNVMEGRVLWEQFKLIGV